MLRSNKIDPNLFIKISDAMSGVFTDSDYAQIIRCLSYHAVNHPDNFTVLQQILLLEASHDDVRKFISSILDNLKYTSTFNSTKLFNAFYKQESKQPGLKPSIKKTIDSNDPILFETIMKILCKNEVLADR